MGGVYLLLHTGYHMRICAIRAFWLVKSPLHGYEMLYLHARTLIIC